MKLYSEKNRTNFNINFIFSVLFIFLLFIGGLNNSSGLLSYLGFLAIGVLLALLFYMFLISLFKKKYILKEEKSIYIYSILFILIYMIGILNELNVESIVIFIQITMVIFFFWGVTYIPFDNLKRKTISNIITIFITINFFWWVSGGLASPFKGLMINSNTFGAFITFLLGFFWLVKPNKFTFFSGITFLMGLTLVYVSNARVTFLVIVASVITYLVWPFLIKKKVFYRCYFLIIVGLILTVSVIYPKLLNHPLGYKLNLLSQHYTGKNFFSGRQYIWSEMLNVIYEKPLFGYGASSKVSNFMDTSLSAHNYYIQMTLQVGLVGSTIFFLFLLAIWNYFYKAKNDGSIRIISSIYIGILIYQLFEVSFTQNNLSLALIQWLIIGLGFFFTRKKVSF